MAHNTQKLRSRGFTLIEIIIVVAIIAVLAAIAVPAMQNHMNKAKRANAAAALSSLQLRMERWRADNPEYPGADTAEADLGAMPLSEAYDISVSSDADATSYTLTATAKSSNTGDEDCGEMTVTVAGQTVSNSPAVCF